MKFYKKWISEGFFFLLWFTFFGRKKNVGEDRIAFKTITQRECLGSWRFPLPRMFFSVYFHQSQGLISTISSTLSTFSWHPLPKIWFFSIPIRQICKVFCFDHYGVWFLNNHILDLKYVVDISLWLDSYVIPFYFRIDLIEISSQVVFVVLYSGDAAKISPCMLWHCC